MEPFYALSKYGITQFLSVLVIQKIESSLDHDGRNLPSLLTDLTILFTILRSLIKGQFAKPVNSANTNNRITDLQNNY